MRIWNRIAFRLFFLSVFLSSHEAQGRVILCDESLGEEITNNYQERYPFYGLIFSSVAYFNFRSLRILYEVDFVMKGHLSLYSRDDLPLNDNSTDDFLYPYNPEEVESLYHPFPTLMLADLETETFEEITAVAKRNEIDFVILAINEATYTWQERFRWWWLKEIPRIPSRKYLASSRTDPPYYLAVSSIDGQYLKKILWEKKNAVLDYGDFSNPTVEIEIDDTSVTKGMDLVIQGTLYIAFMCIALRWLCKAEILEDSFASSNKPKFTVDDLGQGVICEGPSSHECAICLETMPIGTTVRILPCRHSFHHECITGWLKEEKYTCPMCKFDLSQHFEEQKQAKETMQLPRKSLSHRILQKSKAWRFCRTIETDDNQLLEQIGDLELTEEQPASRSQQVEAISVENGVTV